MSPLFFPLSFFFSDYLPTYVPIIIYHIYVSKVVRKRCALYILTWKCALRRNGRQFFDIRTAKSGRKLGCCVDFYVATARTRSFLVWSGGSAPAAFASLLCNPLEPQIIRKTTFLTFRAPEFFFLLTPSPSLFCSSLRTLLSSTLLSYTLIFSLTLPISAFHLSILSEV